MEKINFPKGFKVYWPLLTLFLLLVFIMPRAPKFHYDYKKGSPWMYETLVTQFDFPVLKSAQELQEEREKAGSTVVPYYKLDLQMGVNAETSLSEMALDSFPVLKTRLSEALASIYSKGVIALYAGGESARQNSSGLIYIQRNRRAAKVPVTEVYTIETATAYLRDVIKESTPADVLDSLQNAIPVSSLVFPNLLFDQQTTELVHEENIDFISPTSGIVRTGHVVVSHGEIVTAEVEQLLDSYKAEYNASMGYNGNVAFQWVGNCLIAFCIVLVLFLAIYYCNYSIFNSYNKYLYLLMVFAMAAAGSSLVARTDPSLFYLMPFTLISLYLLAFFSKRVVFSVYFISLIPMLIFAPNGMELFVMYLVAGAVGMLVFGFFNRGWLQFVTALIVFAVLALVWGAFRMIEGPNGLNDYRIVIDMFLGSLMSVAGYPLIFLFEKIFKLVSTTKLVELSDTSNKLLRELADKAPGTFQHSLQVMNLADATARSIDANVPLIRAAALYHDIGKIANPQCFTENENPGVRYHEGLTPKESAQEIIHHVTDGLALADKYHLPQVLKEFIISHHGTSNTGYFYTKYLNDGGDPDDVADFYYNGHKPTTKEQVILMIADAVEAASRSLKDYSPENISRLVDSIIDGKSAAGHFTEADISLREINTVKQVIKTYIQQMYHSRVAYPRRKR
ncbi:MAG: HDIG domain-containing protein [Bacteroidales bacterium]|nr:HDIG domain-containing protein [Bacteroidales bacterium]